MLDVVPAAFAGVAAERVVAVGEDRYIPPYAIDTSAII